MTIQFNRVYELQIGGGNSALVINELRVSFEITKDLLGYPNLAKIEIYNLSRASKALIENEFTSVIMNAGYKGNSKLLFKGDIKNVTHEVRGPDSITIIFAGDGNRDYKESFVSITIGKGASFDDVLNAIVASFSDLKVEIQEGINKVKDHLQGKTISAKSSDAMDQLAEDYNFDWSIQDGAINIIDRNSVVNREFVITPETGMLNSPVITEIGADVTLLLNPELLPGRVINIQSAGANVQLGNLFFRDARRTVAEGKYKIIKIVHSGDTHENNWQTTATGKIV
ncbi:hypothetical protein IID23_02265 [Patescibacteria group bacterium]|nr:hypothetical protein [Patescibacteria group bacterium]